MQQESKILTDENQAYSFLAKIIKIMKIRKYSTYCFTIHITDTSRKLRYNIWWIVIKYPQSRYIKDVFMKQKKSHIISRVYEDSIAMEMGIEPGDELLKINDNDIEDIFDYQYMAAEEHLEVLVRKKDGEEWLLDIDKDFDEDLGLEFENGLMDDYRSCSNKCIFCFIDQMPKGMRDTLYFKDDDSRLSFLQGNYVTLTNMSDKDIDRILRYHLSPINISFQTTNPELRCKMLGNRFAGDALKKVDRLCAEGSGIELNGQI